MNVCTSLYDLSKIENKLNIYIPSLSINIPIFSFIFI